MDHTVRSSSLEGHRSTPQVYRIVLAIDGGRSILFNIYCIAMAIDRDRSKGADPEILSIHRDRLSRVGDDARNGDYGGGALGQANGDEARSSQ